MFVARDETEGRSPRVDSVSVSVRAKNQRQPQRGGILVAQGKAARPQPWDESRVMEGAPQGILNRGTPRLGAQCGNGGSGHINQCECECESEEPAPAGLNVCSPGRARRAKSRDNGALAWSRATGSLFSRYTLSWRATR